MRHCTLEGPATTARNSHGSVPTCDGLQFLGVHSPGTRLAQDLPTLLGCKGARFGLPGAGEKPGPFPRRPATITPSLESW